jgi:uncharacterized integral membrane protein
VIFWTAILPGLLIVITTYVAGYLMGREVGREQGRNDVHRRLAELRRASRTTNR